MTVHGYRAVFSSTMNERSFHRDAVELQLAHVSKDAVRRAYMRAKFKDERVRLMQAWADQLDAWEHGAKVLPLRAAG